jgi:putative ABC transport system ATP-binding protein
LNRAIAMADEGRGTSLVEVREVVKTYSTSEGPLPVLSGVSFDLNAGVSLALTGESGSGKSTLLHLLAGLDRTDSGSIRIEGTELERLGDAELSALRRQRIGLVFQQFNLIPSLDVRSNIAFHARLAGRLDPSWRDELVERLGLSGLLNRYPEQLSGGQQQRVAIARTLAMRPILVLADEPTGNLDEASAASVLALMLDLVRASGAGLIMATHSLRIAGQLDRRLHLSAGRILAC